MVEVIYIPLYPSTGLQDQVECQDFPKLLPEMIFFICLLLLAMYVVIEIIVSINIYLMICMYKLFMTIWCHAWATQAL